MLPNQAECRVVPKIDFAQPVLRLLLCSASFDASPLFPDVRGAITRDLLDLLETKKWQFESHDLFVINENTKRLVTLEPDTMMIMAGEPPADPEALKAECLEIAELVLSQLQVAQFSNFAMNLDWHIGVLKGTGLAAWLHEFLGLSAANPFFDAFGGKPQETEAQFTFHPQENVGLQIQLKPISASEAAEDSFFDEPESYFPDEALELGIWRLSDPEESYNAGDLGEIWMDSYSRMMKMSDRAGLAIAGQQ